MSTSLITTRGGPMHLHGRRLTEPRHPMSVPERPAWFFDRGKACDPFWGNEKLFTSDDKADRAQAVSLCQRRCPFIGPCLERAAAANEQHYVWGGRDFSKEQVRITAARQLVGAR